MDTVSSGDLKSFYKTFGLKFNAKSGTFERQHRVLRRSFMLGAARDQGGGLVSYPESGRLSDWDDISKPNNHRPGVANQDRAGESSAAKRS